MNYVFFLSGITVATFGASALFFYRFWKASHDRFFLFFSAACGLLSLDRIIALFIQATQLTLRNAETEATSWIYLVRLLSFSIILVAVVDKNRRTGL